MKPSNIKLQAQELSAFYTKHPDFDLLDYDFHNSSELKKLHTMLTKTGTKKAGIDKVVDHLKAGQRLLHLHPHPALAESLIGKGIVSANQVARLSRQEFVTEYAQPAGIDIQTAEKIHTRATGIRNKSMHIWASVRGSVASPLLRNSVMDTVSDQLRETLQGLPSYQDLFGSLDYCGCDECRSIFGAAAYLVDLLRIIDEYISKPNASTIPADFQFASRRPDIGKIGLTCSNTNDLVPYLQIVIERLTAYAQQTLGQPDPDKFAQLMATTLIYPRQLPFNAPLNKIQKLLQKASAPLSAILFAWKSPALSVATASLGLSKEQQDIIVTQITTASGIAPYYNVTDIAVLNVADVFIARTQMNFSDLLALLNQDLTLAEQTAGLQVNFFINQDLAGKWVSLKEQGNDQPQMIDNLAAGPLDRINRLLRLSDALGLIPWNVDWILRCLKSGAAPVIDTDALTAIYALRSISSALDTDLLTASVLLGPIKTYGAGIYGAGSAFDLLFNPAGITAKDREYHPAPNPLNPAFKDPAFDWDPDSSDEKNLQAINRVLPGLGVGLSDINLLGQFLFPKASLPVKLTVDTLSALYRHILLSNTLGIPVAQYILLLKLIGWNTPLLPTIGDIQRVIDAAAWMEQTGVSIYSLDYIIRGNLSVYVDPLYAPDTVADWLRGLWVVVSPDKAKQQTDIIAQVAVLFGISNGLANTVMMAAIASQDLPDGVTTWEEAFLTADKDKITPKYEDYVQAVLQGASRAVVLAQSLVIADSTMANVLANPTAYQLNEQFDNPSWGAIQSIQQVQQWTENFGDRQGNLLTYVTLNTTGKAIDDQLDALHKATSWSVEDMKALLSGPLAKETGAITLVSDLQSCMTLMTNLGASPGFMQSVSNLGQMNAKDNWPQFTQTSADVMSKIAGVYGSMWSAVWTTVSGDIDVDLRGALLALVLSELNTKYPDLIKTSSNVYEYLLTNVDIGPATSISYIKEALNAAQIYLQRCRLRLETGVDDMSKIQDPWWEWMMNYRVWEANREIFVYPENYLVPSLQKNTSPQFTALVQALQQSDVNKAYVGSAFRSYINGFGEVAQLKPVDAYRTLIGDTYTIFLLSRSKTGPYTYYYCLQEEGMPWTTWTKIDLSINSPNCTLVYAFNRPFIFWNEVKKTNASAVSGAEGNVQTNNNVTYTSSVMYSFLNQEGKWVQPQTLVNNEPIFYKSDVNEISALMNNDIFEGLFEMEATTWNKIFAFRLSADNYVTPPSFKAEAERLVVMYGPNVINTGSIVEVAPSSPVSDPAAAAFWANLRVRAEDHNRLVTGQLSGEINLPGISVLNMSLENDVLVQRTELLLTDPYQPTVSFPSLLPEMQNSGEVMQITTGARPLNDNRNSIRSATLSSGSAATALKGNSFIGSGINAAQSQSIFSALKAANVLDASNKVIVTALTTLDLSQTLSGMTVYNTFGASQFQWILQVLFNSLVSTELFSSVGGMQVNAYPVGSQPGWLLFFVADEVFLLSPKPATTGDQVFTPLEEGLKIGNPFVDVSFAVMTYEAGSINAALSGEIYTQLAFYGLIQNGVVPSYVTLNNVKLALASLLPPLSTKLTQDQVTYIYLALVNSAILFKDAFIGGKIDAATSEVIYKQLQTVTIIDPNGRVYGDILNGNNVALSLEPLLMNGTISQAQIAVIYKILFQAPKAIALTYANSGESKSFKQTGDVHFNVTRLSTGAINKINRALFVNGVDALLSLKTQQIPVVPVLPFSRFTPSTTNLNWPKALDATQVDFDGLYGQYFWEIFYHIPMLISYGLTANQRFEDAQTWLQYVFDPTVRESFVTDVVIVGESQNEISLPQAKGIITQLQTNNIGTPPKPVLSPDTGEVNPDFSATTDLGFLTKSDPSLTDTQVAMVRNILLNYQLNSASGHYWQFRPFRNHTLQTLEQMLSDDNPAIRIYNDDPFDPFAIARLRIGAFEKSTLMQYIDNLIAWGDQLFTQDNWEAITAAYMLYVYAYDLLGPRPQLVGECPGSDITLTFDLIKEEYPDGIPQFLIDLEHFVKGGNGSDTPMLSHAFNDLYVYFCVPENANLIARWNTVEDRMYKINNSLNIQGVFRQLALFQPPLNPLDLVKAAAASNNVQALAGGVPELSPYRYSSAIATAGELAGVLASLGASLLSVLEKRDSEGLSALQTNQQGQILDMMTDIKKERITELNATIQSLQANLTGANDRLTFYTDLIDTSLSTLEKSSLSATDAALAFNILSSVSRTAATIAYTIPQVGSPFAMTYGGVQIGSSLSAFSTVFEIGAQISNFIAVRTSTMAGYERRAQDWSIQKKIAQADTNSITQQILAAQSQLQSAQQDLAVHLKSIDQNKVIAAYLKDKFTNEELYQWMAGRMSAVFFQTYSVAIQQARQAEAAYQFELDSDRTFLSFDYWDSLHKGLTCGEGLTLALNRLDAAYRKGNTRQLEIEKTISLGMLAPDQLLQLKTTGECSFDFSEALFDYDYPGQYARKIKTISISIPVVLGPYQNIKAILTQTQNKVVTAPSIDVVDYLLGVTEKRPDSGLRENWANNQSIAISKGINDSGMFVLDFQDPRYLPFENTGAVSSWTLSMPIETNRFDFEQISDVIISISYTALFDDVLKTGVIQSLAKAGLPGGVYVNGDMQSASWFAFLSDHSDPAKQKLTLKVDVAQIGFFKSINYTSVIIQLDTLAGVKIPDGASFLSMPDAPTPVTIKFTEGQAELTGLKWDVKKMPVSWEFDFDLNDKSISALLTGGFIDGSKLLNMQVIALYDAKIF